MACVILPSETARLVYGYLVKENLNEIALQFLESSPYLTDCCQIVKNGYQFNTKLMSKDLQELLQEYSVIHNLVNNKVNLLCKTSLLYKRIKLRCENLAEILELILFWKYRNIKNEENSQSNEKIKKNCLDGEYCEYIKNSDDFNVKLSNANTPKHNCNNVNNSSPAQNNINSFHPKLHCEKYFTDKDDQKEKSIVLGMSNQENNINKSRISVGEPVPLPEIAETREIKKNCNISSDDINTANNNFESSASTISNLNVLTIDLNSENSEMLSSEIQMNTLGSNEKMKNFNVHMKLVEVEKENQNQNCDLNIYSKTSEQQDDHVNFENSSVVFVSSSEVGNVAIDQEENQIIVIPIDYYKTQDEMQNKMEMDNNQNNNLVQKDIVNQQKEEIIFEGISALGSSTNTTQFCSEKNLSVDDNIITGKNFLNDHQFVFNLENELEKAEIKAQTAKECQETEEKVSIHPVSAAPLIMVSQTVIPNKAPRYRAILPKKEEVKYPVVVVQPLLENNKNSIEPETVKGEPKHKKKIVKIKPKVKTKNSLTQKQNLEITDNSKNLKEFPLSEMTDEKDNMKNCKTDILCAEKKPETALNCETITTNEEKENCTKKEEEPNTGKTETPIFVSKKNSKRLSLSTPRRRSHIRALEFETPPKISEDRKKPKTSPKVKVDQITFERRNIRNTLFKSPLPENTLESTISTENKKMSPLKSEEIKEPLNEICIPIATRSPNAKLSEAWENLTGVGCVIGTSESLKSSPTKKMWDADLRCFITENVQGVSKLEKKRVRKPDRIRKTNRKTKKKRIVSAKKNKSGSTTVSPSKISLTAKRNTYSINGNEEGSPIRSLLDDLKIVTPFKDIETVRPTEETPLTKLLRENINTIDIDLSMINTPSFPPTPSIVITPEVDDLTMTGANYYSPVKENSKDKILKITDYIKTMPEKTNRKESREIHEKVIDDLVSKAKEIIGIGKESQEEKILNRRPSGKILSMVKIQMLTQCNKKLCENIPINEDCFSNSFINKTTLIGNLNEDVGGKRDLKEELEEKRKRALKKIKVVKENLSQAKSRVTKRKRKRKRSGNTSVSDKSKSDTSSDTIEENQRAESEYNSNFKEDHKIIHSTPYVEINYEQLDKSDSSKKVDARILGEIRQYFPPFEDNADSYPELSEKSRKKLFYVKNFLKLSEIKSFLNDFDEKNPQRLFLKSSLRKFFQIFYKWLRHPHKRELNASSETKALLLEYLSDFNKISLGLRNRNKNSKNNTPENAESSSSCVLRNNSWAKSVFSDDEDKEWKKRENEKRKDEESEDGVVSTLPLKKRKSTVQQVDIKSGKYDSKTHAENVSQTQNFLQDIDVDRFLSQIHGQENR